MEGNPPSTFAQFLNCLEGLAVITASCVAIWGINAWRREHVRKHRIDLAEKTLALFYEARDVINATRSALGQTGDTELVETWTSEGHPGPGEPTQPPILALRLSRRQRRLFSRIHALQFRFAAVFEQAAAQPFHDLLKVRRDVLDAEYEYLLSQHDVHRTGEDHMRRMTELIHTMHSGRNDSDPTTRRLNEIVERIEQVCRPVIESYGRTLAGALLMRGRGVLGILQSQPWFARLPQVWGRTQHHASRSGHVAPPSDSSAP
jgi:hypothetical protein